MAKEKETSKEGWAASFAYSANFWATLKGLPASTRLAVHDAVCAYGIEGVKCKTDDPIANAVLEGIYIQMDNMKAHGQRRKRGGQIGNQNARKHWNADGEKEGVNDLFEGVKNETNANEYKTNKNEYKTNKNEYPNECKTNTPSNSLNNSDLDKTNKTNKNEYGTNIREYNISLDNTSPSTELVLSKQKEKLTVGKTVEQKEKAEPALATGEGGAVPSFSTAEAVLNADAEKRHGAQSMPRPSSPIDTERKSPHTPSPRSPEYKCAERFLRGIEGYDILYNNSKEAEIEREKTRKAKLVQLRDMETDPLQKSAITEIINSIRIVS